MNDSSSLGEPANADQPSRWMGSAWLAILVIALTILIKVGIVCFAGFDLTFDEAYYWHWSKNLDWCYFSKGPGIALLIRATTALAETPFSVFGSARFSVRRRLSSFSIYGDADSSTVPRRRW